MLENNSNQETIVLAQRLSVMYRMFTGCESQLYTKEELTELVHSMGTGVSELYQRLSS
ncbi:hypothetical protein [Vibrio parahaemolyticus]|uniref:hypothetical protein n=1 Tax=Vibrio parahaemolyticus TaxID=670 RepID=UPI000AF361A6|nr:hypothetical protein [Vibrio parahaemolyticus]